eukprot:632053-Rhodomonas_salina.1
MRYASASAIYQHTPSQYSQSVAAYARSVPDIGQEREGVVIVAAYAASTTSYPISVPKIHRQAYLGTGHCIAAYAMAESAVGTELGSASSASVWCGTEVLWEPYDAVLNTAIGTKLAYDAVLNTVIGTKLAYDAVLNTAIGTKLAYGGGRRCVLSTLTWRKSTICS